MFNVLYSRFKFPIFRKSLLFITIPVLAKKKKMTRGGDCRIQFAGQNDCL